MPKSTPTNKETKKESKPFTYEVTRPDGTKVIRSKSNGVVRDISNGEVVREFDTDTGVITSYKKGAQQAEPSTPTIDTSTAQREQVLDRLAPKPSSTLVRATPTQLYGELSTEGKIQNTFIVEGTKVPRFTQGTGARIPAGAERVEVTNTVIKAVERGQPNAISKPNEPQYDTGRTVQTIQGKDEPTASRTAFVIQGIKSERKNIIEKYKSTLREDTYKTTPSRLNIPEKYRFFDPLRTLERGTKSTVGLIEPTLDTTRLAPVYLGQRYYEAEQFTPQERAKLIQKKIGAQELAQTGFKGAEESISQSFVKSTAFQVPILNLLPMGTEKGFKEANYEYLLAQGFSPADARSISQKSLNIKTSRLVEEGAIAGATIPIGIETTGIKIVGGGVKSAVGKEGFKLSEVFGKSYKGSFKPLATLGAIEGGAQEFGQESARGKGASIKNIALNSAFGAVTAPTIGGGIIGLEFLKSSPTKAVSTRAKAGYNILMGGVYVSDPTEIVGDVGARAFKTADLFNIKEPRFKVTTISPTEAIVTNVESTKTSRVRTPTPVNIFGYTPTPTSTRTPLETFSPINAYTPTPTSTTITSRTTIPTKTPTPINIFSPTPAETETGTPTTTSTTTPTFTTTVGIPVVTGQPFLPPIPPVIPELGMGGGQGTRRENKRYFNELNAGLNLFRGSISSNIKDFKTKKQSKKIEKKVRKTEKKQSNKRIDLGFGISLPIISRGRR